MVDKQSMIRAALFVLAVVAFVACQEGDLEVGQRVAAPTELGVQLVDSFTVQTETVLADTFVTSADSSVLVGKWTDALTGRTEARGFASLVYATNDLPNRTDARFDSLVLVLPLASAYGDTTQPFTLNIHRLIGEIEDKTHYNLEAAPYETTPFLTKLVRPWPRSGSRQLRIRLPAELGQSFFDRLRNRAISDDQTLKSFLSGLAFAAPDMASNLFLGLNVSSGSGGLLLYYHQTDIDRTRSSLAFTLQGTHFSQMQTDRSQTPLRNLLTRSDAVSSGQTQHVAFVVAGAMLRTRLRIPALDELAFMEQYRGVNRAELTIEPVQSDVRNNASPPAQLVLYQTNSVNEALAAVPDGTGTAVSGYYGYDLTDLEQKGHYAFNITYYINEIIAGRFPNRPLLLMTPSSESTLPLERLTIGDSRNPTYRMRLRLYVTVEP